MGSMKQSHSENISPSQFSFTLTASGGFLVLRRLYVSLPCANPSPRFGQVTVFTGNLINLFFHLDVYFFLVTLF